MNDVFLPPPEETKLKVRVGTGDVVEIEIVDVIRAHTEAMSRKKETDTPNWTPFFISEMRNRGINLSETTAVILVEKATSAMVQIKKDSRGLPEQLSTSEPQSPQTKES